MRLNILDRMIAAVAPEAGLRRAQNRVRLDRIRGYEAGRPGDREQHWGNRATGPNAEVRPALSRLRNSARELDRDNAHAKRITTTVARHQVGYGITPRSATGVEALDERIDGIFKRWAKRAELSGEVDLYGWQRRMAKARSVSGEAIGRLVRLTGPQMRKAGLEIPLQLEALEPDMLADNVDVSHLRMQPDVVQGVEFAEGRRVAYWMHRAHPGEASSMRVRSDTLSRWPASEIMHVYRAHDERPGQVRGIPDLTPVLLRARRLEDYEIAAVEQAKAQAMLGIVFETETPAEMGTVGSGAGGKAAAAAPIEMYPGMVVNAPIGAKPHFLQPSGEGAFEPFAMHQLRIMAIGAGLTYDQVTGDLRQANYSSLRAGRIEFRAMIEEDQWLMLVPRMCDPVWAAFIEACLLVGLLEPREGGYPAEWMPPRVQLLDPSQDIPALRGMRRMGLETWSQQVMAYGTSPRQQARDLAAENELFDDLGLILDGDPRRISASGGAQDPKQNAAIEIAATGAAQPRQPDAPAARAPLPPGYRRSRSGLLLPQ